MCRYRDEAGTVMMLFTLVAAALVLLTAAVVDLSALLAGKQQLDAFSRIASYTAAEGYWSTDCTGLTESACHTASRVAAVNRVNDLMKHNDIFTNPSKDPVVGTSGSVDALITTGDFNYHTWLTNTSTNTPEAIRVQGKLYGNLSLPFSLFGFGGGTYPMQENSVAVYIPTRIAVLFALDEQATIDSMVKLADSISSNSLHMVRAQYHWATNTSGGPTVVDEATGPLSTDMKSNAPTRGGNTTVLANARYMDDYTMYSLTNSNTHATYGNGAYGSDSLDTYLQNPSVNTTLYNVDARRTYVETFRTAASPSYTGPEPLMSIYDGIVKAVEEHLYPRRHDEDEFTYIAWRDVTVPWTGIFSGNRVAMSQFYTNYLGGLRTTSPGPNAAVDRLNKYPFLPWRNNSAVSAEQQGLDLQLGLNEAMKKFASVTNSGYEVSALRDSIVLFTSGFHNHDSAGYASTPDEIRAKFATLETWVKNNVVGRAILSIVHVGYAGDPHYFRIPKFEGSSECLSDREARSANKWNQYVSPTLFAQETLTTQQWMDWSPLTEETGPPMGSEIAYRLYRLALLTGGGYYPLLPMNSLCDAIATDCSSGTCTKRQTTPVVNCSGVDTVALEKTDVWCRSIAEQAEDAIKETIGPKVYRTVQ